MNKLLCVLSGQSSKTWIFHICSEVIHHIYSKTYTLKSFLLFHISIIRIWRPNPGFQFIFVNLVSNFLKICFHRLTIRGSKYVPTFWLQYLGLFTLSWMPVQRIVKKLVFGSSFFFFFCSILLLAYYVVFACRLALKRIWCLFNFL